MSDERRVVYSIKVEITGDADGMGLFASHPRVAGVLSYDGDVRSKISDDISFLGVYPTREEAKAALPNWKNLLPDGVHAID